MNARRAMIERKRPAGRTRFSTGPRLACALALLGVTLLPLEGTLAQVDTGFAAAPREPVQKQMTIYCGQVPGVDSSTTLLTVPRDKLLVIENVGIVMHAQPEDRLSVYTVVAHPVAQGMPGPRFIYPVVLEPAVPPQSSLRTGMSGNLGTRIYAGGLDTETPSHVQIMITTGYQAAPDCQVKASLSGYLVPVASPTLSP